jgi:hypothetical protein
MYSKNTLKAKETVLYSKYTSQSTRKAQVNFFLNVGRFIYFFIIPRIFHQQLDQCLFFNIYHCRMLLFSQLNNIITATF